MHRRWRSLWLFRLKGLALAARAAPRYRFVFITGARVWEDLVVPDVNGRGKDEIGAALSSSVAVCCVSRSCSCIFCI